MSDQSVREIVISAEGWKTPDDFYVPFLAAIGAPPWHGHNLDALWDSITGGDINRTSPPYQVRITGIAQASEGCKQLIDNFLALMGDAKAKGTPVEIVCEP
jgi:RNAse (barnase) inhibitor barstar